MCHLYCFLNAYLDLDEGMQVAVVHLSGKGHYAVGK